MQNTLLEMRSLFSKIASFRSKKELLLVYVRGFGVFSEQFWKMRRLPSN